MLFQDFPTSDAITRRLKKLLHLIMAHEKESDTFDYESDAIVDLDLKE